MLKQLSYIFFISCIKDAMKRKLTSINYSIKYIIIGKKDF